MNEVTKQRGLHCIPNKRGSKSKNFGLVERTAHHHFDFYILWRAGKAEYMRLAVKDGDAKPPSLV